MGFVAERLTVYVSPGDKAIGLSNWLFGSRRRIGQRAFGDLGEEMAKVAKHHPVMAVVDVRAKTEKPGHGYFLSSSAALSDVILLLRDHLAPGAEHGRPLHDSPHGFWELRDDYPAPHKAENPAPASAATASRCIVRSTVRAVSRKATRVSATPCETSNGPERTRTNPKTFEENRVFQKARCKMRCTRKKGPRQPRFRLGEEPIGAPFAG